MELKDIITYTIAIAAIVIGILQYRKIRKLEEEKFLYQKEQDAQKELNGAVEDFEKKQETRSAAQIYCDHISQKFKTLDFTGLNALLQKPLLLEDIYVRLRTQRSLGPAAFQTIADFNRLEKLEKLEKLEEAKMREALVKAKKAEKEAEGTEDDDFVSVFERMVKAAQQRREPLKMLILGQPGSGKTTLMKWLALQCAGAKGIFEPFLPVFIALKDLARDPDHTYRAKNLLDLTHDLLTGETISPSFLRDRFEESGLLFLLDGLDEVADESLRREVIHWIQKQNLRKNALIVTSRFSGLQESKGLKFPDAVPVFAIRDFDIAEIERFLENWYRNIEVAMAGETGPTDQEEAVKKGRTRYEDLMNIIKDQKYQNLRQLAVNPLLLTIIAIVHRTRAVLPKERHKLYEECLKVMIELWNVANRKIDVSFSVDNSLVNLAKIAVFLMKENRRELDPAEMESLLPLEIEKRPREFFIREMVLKAGLLYESEGKYGFLHLTFQEYLAAWHYARGENPQAILENREKDYWQETFKLFVNIANARLFFNEIIGNLAEKEYWTHMQLWDNCLIDIATEETKREIEMQFARKVIELLLSIEYREENEPLIMQLYAHYPLYKAEHAGQLITEGWNLFHHAKHPFVQSVGSSILFKAGEPTQGELIEAVKKRIEQYENINDKTGEQLVEFLYRNNNSFVLLIAGRKNVRDFSFAAAKLKSRDIFIRYTNLRGLRCLRDLIDFRDLLDLLDLRDLRDLLYLLDLLYLRDLRDLRDRGDLRGLRYLLYLLYLRYLRDLRYLIDLRDLRDLLYLLDLRDRYIEKYEAVFKEHEKEIEAWAEKALAKLQKLSDEELLKYFPGTSAEDMKHFRTHYPPFIARELGKGNYTFFKELELTADILAETEALVDNAQGPGTFYHLMIKICSDKSAEMRAPRKTIIQYLLDRDKLRLEWPTVLALLNFDLDPDQIEHQDLELRAFYALREKDYALLRELVVRVVEVRPDEDTSLNAVFIFKYIN